MVSEVCLVDDEDGILEMVKDYLGDSYKVRIFNSPEDALTAIGSNYRPDLLVTDIKMPNMDGFDLLTSVRGKMPSLPVVMMSGYAEKHHILKAMDFDVYGFVEKPFRPQKLREIIQGGVAHSRRLRGLETLVEKLDVLAKAALDLNKIYASRFLTAEAKPSEVQVSLPADQAQSSRHETDLRLQSDLEFVINRMQTEITELIEANPQLANPSLQLPRT